MNFGAMREIVTLQEPGSGGYVDVQRVPVQIEMTDTGGVEVLQYEAPTAIGYFRMIMRYRDDIRADWRMVHDDGRVFQISSYGDVDGRRQAMKVYATVIQ